MLKNVEIHVFGQFTLSAARTFFSSGATTLYTFADPLPVEVITARRYQSLGVMGDLLLFNDLNAQAQVLADDFDNSRRRVLTVVPGRQDFGQVNTGEFDVFEAYDEDDVMFIESRSLCRGISSWRGTYFFCPYYSSPQGMSALFEHSAQHPEHDLLQLDDLRRIAAMPNAVVTAAWTTTELEWFLSVCPDVKAIGLIFFDPALPRSRGMLDEFVSQSLRSNHELLEFIDAKQRV